VDLIQFNNGLNLEMDYRSYRSYIKEEQ